MATRLDNYLKALLALSGDEQFVAARNGLIRNMHNDELVELVSHSASREFARGNLEEIAAFLLDVIANEPGPERANNASTANRNTRVKTEYEESEIADLPEPPQQVIVSLRTQKAQIIAGKLVQAIDIFYWNPKNGRYIALDFSDESEDSLATRFTKGFDADYLSTDLHIKEWGKLLRLREKSMHSQCCVNQTIRLRSKLSGGHTLGEKVGDTHVAYDGCIQGKRLCARSFNSNLVNHAFFPLPSSMRLGKDIQELGYWVQE